MTRFIKGLFFASDPKHRRVKFINKSNALATACIYQAFPSSYQGDFHQLAWLVQKAHPTVSAEFKWKETYAFIWGKSRSLDPGVVIKASQTVSAQSDISNAITLDIEQGAYLFENQMSQTPSGTYVITQTPQIPVINHIAVGMAMGNRPLFVAPASPNLTYSLMLDDPPQYFITNATVRKGAVLPNPVPGQTAALVFEPGVDRLTATLTPQNTWDIQQG